MALTSSPDLAAFLSLLLTLRVLQEAVEQLQQLSATKPNDPDVWRVLAESQSALGDRSAAVASYRRAWQEVTAAGGSGPGALEVLQGLAGELVAAGQQQQVGQGRAGQGRAGQGGIGWQDAGTQGVPASCPFYVRASLLGIRFANEWLGSLHSVSL